MIPLTLSEQIIQDLGQQTKSFPFLPYQPVRPVPNHLQNQIQQVKGAGVSPLTPVSPSASPNTQGLPQAGTNISVSKRLVSGQWQVAVAFNRNTSDPYYQEMKIYALQGQNRSPVLVASGQNSPLIFTMPKSGKSTTFVCRSAGNWGLTPLANSPVISTRL